ncbi:hypothetical protein ACFWDI_18965 [Streptomyces sp. NPDC060064]|uniref:DUF6197 family protein n=1 Tax=Streptomyces sp. NPDC060064 TaxID=3347049 RepID=UPI0036C349B1
MASAVISDTLTAACPAYNRLKQQTVRYDTSIRETERIALTHALYCPTCQPIADRIRQQRTDAAVADACDAAGDVIDVNGYQSTYLWNVKQEQAGTPLKQCAVDVAGAILVAVHGTPRHLGSPLTRAAERILASRAQAPSLAAWSSYPGNGKAQAMQLLRDTADELQAGVTA